VRTSAFGRRVGVTVRASYPHPTLKYWCALSTTSPGQSRGRAGASPLSASPTVPACRPAYAADATCHWATRHNSTGSRLSLCKIAHAHQVSTGLARLKRECFAGAWGWKASWLAANTWRIPIAPSSFDQGYAEPDHCQPARRVLLIGAGLLSISALMPSAHSAEGVAQNGRPVIITRFFTGPDGLTHAEEIEVKFAPGGGAYNLLASSGAQLRRTPPGRENAVRRGSMRWS
jgi:hypothetical protein